MGHAEMLREQSQLIPTDEEDDEKHSFVVPQKRKSKADQKAKPMKKKKNDGMTQESQIFEDDTSDSD